MITEQNNVVKQRPTWHVNPPNIEVQAQMGVADVKEHLPPLIQVSAFGIDTAHTVSLN